MCFLALHIKKRQSLPEDLRLGTDILHFLGGVDMHPKRGWGIDLQLRLNCLEGR